jgi:hypothetical protein
MKELNAIPRQGNREYDTKTFVWHNSPSRFSVMVTKVKAGDGDPFAIEGFDGEFPVFTGFTGGKMETEYDPYAFSMATNEANLRSFLQAIRMGIGTGGEQGIPWETIRDGMKYTPEEVDKLL